MATPVAVPEILVEQTGDHLTVIWSDSEENVTTSTDGVATSETTQFRVEYSADEASWSTLTTVEWPTMSYADTAFTSGTRYYRVYALNGDGDADDPSPSVAGTARAAPTAPSTAVAATFPGYISVTWELAATDETSIELQRNVDSAGYAALATLPAGTESYMDTDVDGGSSYLYRVRTVNAAGESAYVEVVAVAEPSAALPAQPTDLTAQRSSTDVVLTWTDTASGGGTGYQVQRSEDQGQTWSTLTAVLDPGTETYTDTTSAAGTRYSYRVRVLDTVNGDSAWSGQTTIVASALEVFEGTDAVPAAPFDLRANADSASQISLAWLDCSGDERGFHVYRRVKGVPPYARVASKGENVTSHTDTGLASSTTYEYVVTAWNQSGESAYSNVAEATTEAASAPNAPSNLALALAERTALTVSWTDNASNETGFDLELLDLSQNTSFQGRVPTANLTSWRFTPLPPNRTYRVRVRAYREAAGVVSVSAWSNSAFATTLGSTNTLNAAENVRCTNIEQNSMSVEWEHPHGNAVDGFELQRSKNGFSNIFVVARIPLAGTTYAIDDAGLEPGTTYHYRVVSFSGDDRAISATATGITSRPIAEAPDAPTDVTAEQWGGIRVRVTFADASDNEDGFTIYRKEGAGAYAALADLPPATSVGETIEYLDEDALSAGTWTYKVRSFAGDQESDDSNEAEVTLTEGASAPDAPSSLVAYALDADTALLTWADNSDNEVAFEIERSTTSGSGFTNISDVGVNVTEYVDSGLTASTTYYYRVRAVNDTGNSAYTSEASVTTPSGAGTAAPTGPTSVTAVTTGPSSANVYWNSGTGLISSYQVQTSTNGTDYTTARTVAASVRGVSLVDLTPNTDYLVRVVAVGPGGSGIGAVALFTTVSGSGGRGLQPGVRGIDLFAREFEVDSEAVILLPATTVDRIIEFALIQTDDAENGPGVTVTKGGVTIATLGPQA